MDVAEGGVRCAAPKCLLPLQGIKGFDGWARFIVYSVSAFHWCVNAILLSLHAGVFRVGGIAAPVPL